MSNKRAEIVNWKWYAIVGACLLLVFYTRYALYINTVVELPDEYGYLADTHTSVALDCAEQYLNETADKNKIIIASTASPYKFAADVLCSLGENRPEDDLMALDLLSKRTSTKIPAPLADIEKREVRFKKVINKDDMITEVANALGI